MPEQAPDEVIDYAITYEELLPYDDLIIESEWTVDPAISLVRTGITGRKTVAYITGGVIGTDYPIKNQVTSAEGRVCDLTFTLKIREV